jgi:methionine synthase I (cobalamin-dependent)
MARVIGDMIANSAGATPISAQPNAGWPEMVNNRVVYVSTPDYMATFARRMFDGGAKILGGCCGTTPAHIKAIADALKTHAETATEQHAPRNVRVGSGPLRKG